MTEQFDPYHVWLGIPPEEQPPHHYRLLGIKPFEDNRDVIENATDQKVIHLRTFQLSKYRELAEKLLNEVAAAKVSLLNPSRKAAYDQQLRQQLSPAKNQPGEDPLAAKPGQGGDLAEETFTRPAAAAGGGQLGSSRKLPAILRQRAVFVATVGLGLLGIFGIVVWALTARARHPDGKETALTAPNGSRVAVGGKDNATAEVKPSAVEITNSIGMKLALIPAGQFAMGSTPEQIAWGQRKAGGDKWQLERVSSEGPPHRVKISRPFYLGVYPVTQGEYQQVMGSNPSSFTQKQIPSPAFQPPLEERELKFREVDVRKVAGRDTTRHPVEMVDWEEAMEFCRRLSAMPAERAAGRVYRLPTEAEWEYACRAGTTTHWYSGDDEAQLVDIAWFRKNSEGTTHPVGQRKPNAWGLYDMYGNVSQWCADWFGKDYYTHSSPSDPTGPPTGHTRVLRGGGWDNFPSICRSAFRNNSGPAGRHHLLGFRVLAGR
jgi:formylglycine-generating enzyme required for sulfatase activity